MQAAATAASPPPRSRKARTPPAEEQGQGGLVLGGVPSFPGITDNLLVGLAGLALPFLDAKRDPPVATERL